MLTSIEQSRAHVALSRAFFDIEDDIQKQGLATALSRYAYPELPVILAAAEALKNSLPVEPCRVNGVSVLNASGLTWREVPIILQIAGVEPDDGIDGHFRGGGGEYVSITREDLVQHLLEALE